jgi:GNAT superfamily N-acetyltransferase
MARTDSVDVAEQPAIRPFRTAAPLPAGLVLRHLAPPDDYQPMNAIANALRAAQGDNFYTTDDQFQKFYENLSRCDPATDVAIAEVDGRVVGYGRAAWHEELDGTRIYEVIPFVDPAVAGQGVFTAMIDAIEARARAIAAEHPAGEKVL